MKNKVFFLSIFLLIFSVTSPIYSINVLGIDTEAPWDYEIISELTNVTFTEVSISDFATTNLDLYDVLFVSETFTNSSVTLASQATLDALASRESDISSWLYNGHGIVALSEPIGTNPFDWIPNSIEPDVTFSGNNNISIVDPLHPVMQGLTNQDLSGWNTSSHGFLTVPENMDLLAVDSLNRPITLAGNYGFGKVVLTQQDPDFHNYYGNRKPGQITFVQNAIDWVSTPVVPEPLSIISLFLSILGLGIVKLKK